MPRAAATLLAAAAALAASLPGARATVTVSACNRTRGPFPDLPADFGPPLRSPLTARAVRSDPPDACGVDAIAPPPRAPRHGPPPAWVAVIARSKRRGPGCTFGAKVRAAAAAGAAAAVVYDDAAEPLVIMADDGRRGRHGRHGGGGGDDDDDGLIPSVFVSSRAGRALVAAAAADPDGAAVTIAPVGADSLLASLLVSAVAGILAVAVVVATLHAVAERAARAGDRATATAAAAAAGGYAALPGGGVPLTPAQLRALPVTVFGDSDDEGDAGYGGDAKPPRPPPAPRSSDAEACGICLDPYARGDAVRRLPRCGHQFHAGCVDEWLSSRARSCPLCKADAAAPPPPADVESGAAAPPPARERLWWLGRRQQQQRR